jgi:hypothetical protein
MELFVRIESLDLPDTETFKEEVTRVIRQHLLKEFRVQKQPQAKHVPADFKIEIVDINDYR